MRDLVDALFERPDDDPVLMGIVNVTPDSFSDGGQFCGVDAAVAHAERLVAEGADVLDIGGESTRPGAAPVSLADELARVVPVIAAVSATTDVPISIDTRKPEIAVAAVEAGAAIWNDVSALTASAESLATAGTLQVPVVLMHAQGDPRTMQDAPHYGDVVTEVADFLRERIAAAVAAGVPANRLVIDPGIGFGKTLDHNLALFRSLGQFGDLGAPVLLGASRKRFIAGLDRNGPADDRVAGSVASVLWGFDQGVRWFRVHDVAATRQALAVWRGISGRVHPL